MGLWSRIKSAAKKVVSTVKQAFAPAPAPSKPAPAPAPSKPAPLPTSTSNWTGAQPQSSKATPTAVRSTRAPQPGSSSSAPAPQPSPVYQGTSGGYQQQPIAPMGEPTVPSGIPYTVPADWTVGQRLQNVVDVYKISLNPFSDERIIAEVNNAPIKYGLEGAANNPFTTALVISGLYHAGAAGMAAYKGLSVTAATQTAITGVEVGVGQIAVNTVTTKLAETTLIQAGFTVGAIMALKSGVESFTFGNFQIAEAMDKISFARTKAAEEGKWELVEQLNTLMDEILYPSGWDWVISKTPWLTAQRGIRKNLDAAKLQREVDDEIIEDTRTAETNNETNDDKWARIREKETAQEKEAIDYYNEQRKQLLEWEEAVKDRDMREDAKFWAEQTTAERAAHYKQLEKEAKFWADQKAQQRKKEAEDRQAIADFWFAYRKRLQQLDDNNRPSNLNFGLL